MPGRVVSISASRPQGAQGLVYSIALVESGPGADSPWLVVRLPDVPALVAGLLDLHNLDRG